MSVSLAFIDSLGREHFVSKVVSNLFHLLSKFVDICQLDSILSSNTETQGFRRFKSEARVLSTIGEERGSESSYRRGVIGSKFSSRDLPSLIILHIISEGTKVIFYNSVYSFYLAISLRVVRG